MSGGETNNGSLMVRTRKQLADLFGVSVTAVGNWKTEPWWDESAFMRAGWYYLPAIVQGYIGARGSKQRNTETAANLRLAVEAETLQKLKLENARNKRREERELGNTLPADIYREFVREWLTQCLEEFETLVQCSAHFTPVAYYDDFDSTAVLSDDFDPWRVVAVLRRN